MRLLYAKVAIFCDIKDGDKEFMANFAFQNFNKFFTHYRLWPKTTKPKAPKRPAASTL